MCLSDRHAVFRAACPYSLYHTVPPCGNAAAAFLEENMKKRLLSGLVLLALLQCLMLPAFAVSTMYFSCVSVIGVSSNFISYDFSFNSTTFH